MKRLDEYLNEGAYTETRFTDLRVCSCHLADQLAVDASWGLDTNG